MMLFRRLAENLEKVKFRSLKFECIVPYFEIAHPCNSRSSARESRCKAATSSAFKGVTNGSVGVVGPRNGRNRLTSALRVPRVSAARHAWSIVEHLCRIGESRRSAKDLIREAAQKDSNKVFSS